MLYHASSVHPSWRRPHFFVNLVACHWFADSWQRIVVKCFVVRFYIHFHCVCLLCKWCRGTTWWHWDILLDSISYQNMKGHYLTWRTIHNRYWFHSLKYNIQGTTWWHWGILLGSISYQNMKDHLLAWRATQHNRLHTLFMNALSYYHTIVWICPSVCPFRIYSAVSGRITTKSS